MFLLLNEHCASAATTGGRTSVINTNPSAESGDKHSRPVIMHSAFQNAGKTPGLEIWRVEVGFSQQI